MRAGLEQSELPPKRVVIGFTFEGLDSDRIWLVPDGEDSSVCTHHPMFDVDVDVDAMPLPAFGSKAGMGMDR